MDIATDHSNVDTPSMTDWANEPKVSDLKQNITDADSDQKTHQLNVERWLKNRAAERTEVKGRSNVQPKLIRKQAEWRYSSLSDPFLATPDLFNVYPTTAGDVLRARQNGLVLNKQFNTQVDKVAFIDDYVHEVVDTGTVIVKVGWISREEEVEVKVPTYRYLPDETGQLAEFYMTLLKLRVEEPDEYADHSTPGLDHALELFQRTGVAMHADPTGTSVQTKIIETTNQPNVEVVPSENIIIDPSCNGNLKNAGFIGEKFISSLSELEKDGRYTNLDQINIENAQSPIEEPDMTVSADLQSFTFKDKPRKKFIVYTYWGEWDIDNSGVTKQIVCSWVGDVCIRKELNPFPFRRPPFAKAVYMPVRQSAWGEPDGELLKDNQDIIGAVTRGAIDLLAKSSNAQTGMRKDMLDVTNRRLFKSGSDYEFNAGVDVRQGVFQHTFPEIPRSVFDMLGIQNTEAESLTGVKAYTSGVNSQSLGSVASNARSALDAAARRELGILRRLSAGILEIGRMVIAMNSEFLSEKEVVRITDNKFIQVRRDDLAGNFDLRLAISTIEEDNQKASELAFMLQTGGPNMDLEFIKIILSEIARLRKMPELAEKIERFQPQPDPIAQKKMMMEMELMSAQIEKERALAFKHIEEGKAASGRNDKDWAQADLNRAKASEEMSKGRLHGSQADQLDLDYVQTADGTKHAQDVQKQAQKDGSAILLEKIKQEGQQAKAKSTAA